jgi:hypothetical protein
MPSPGCRSIDLELLFGEDRPFPRDGGVTILGPGHGPGRRDPRL